MQESFLEDFARTLGYPLDEAEKGDSIYEAARMIGKRIRGWVVKGAFVIRLHKREKFFTVACTDFGESRSSGLPIRGTRESIILARDSLNKAWREVYGPDQPQHFDLPTWEDCDGDQ